MIDVTVGNKSSECISFLGASLISERWSRVEQEKKNILAIIYLQYISLVCILKHTQNRGLILISPKTNLIK